MECSSLLFGLSCNRLLLMNVNYLNVLFCSLSLKTKWPELCSRDIFKNCLKNYFTCKLSKEFSQSVVSISLRFVPSRSISAYIPIGSFPIHSSFIICILLRRCLARCPWIRKAIMQSPHLNGRGLSVDGAPKVALILTLLKCPTERLCFWRCPFVLKLTAQASHLKGLSK